MRKYKNAHGDLHENQDHGNAGSEGIVKIFGERTFQHLTREGVSNKKIMKIEVIFYILKTIETLFYQRETFSVFVFFTYAGKVCKQLRKCEGFCSKRHAVRK